MPPLLLRKAERRAMRIILSRKGFDSSFGGCAKCRFALAVAPRFALRAPPCDRDSRMEWGQCGFGFY